MSGKCQLLAYYSSLSHCVFYFQRDCPRNNLAVERSSGETHVHPSKSAVRSSRFVKNCLIADDVLSSTSYSVFIMQRRTDLWGPDGTILVNMPQDDKRKSNGQQLSSLIQIVSSMTAQRRILFITHTFLLLLMPVPVSVSDNKSVPFLFSYSLHHLIWRTVRI
jgi:hypothetical protein